MKREKKPRKYYLDHAINAMLIIGIVLISIGVLAAIWITLIGLKVAATGAVLMAEAYILYRVSKLYADEQQEHHRRQVR